MLEITEKISPSRPSLAYLNRRAAEFSRTIRPEGYTASRKKELYIYVFTTKVWCVVCRLNDLTWPESIACWKILLKAAPSWLSMALAVYICEFFVVSSSPHITFDSFFFVARASLFSFAALLFHMDDQYFFSWRFVFEEIWDLYNFFVSYLSLAASCVHPSLIFIHRHAPLCIVNPNQSQWLERDWVELIMGMTERFDRFDELCVCYQCRWS